MVDVYVQYMYWYVFVENLTKERTLYQIIKGMTENFVIVECMRLSTNFEKSKNEK